MTIDQNTVTHLAKLARINLTEAEAMAVLGPLNNMMSLIEKMQSVNTEGIVPMTHPGDPILRLRADDVTEHVQRDRLQQSAPEVVSGLYVVPRVIE